MRREKVLGEGEREAADSLDEEGEGKEEGVTKGSSEEITSEEGTSEEGVEQR